MNVKKFLKEHWVLVLSFIYIVSPIDLIPGDLATGIGLIDDIVVLLSTTAYLVMNEVKEEKRREGKEA
jgi:uncharacterized membrane protein YkvA (DUF1232 family)